MNKIMTRIESVVRESEDRRVQLKVDLRIALKDEILAYEGRVTTKIVSAEATTTFLLVLVLLQQTFMFYFQLILLHLILLMIHLICFRLTYHYVAFHASYYTF